MSVIQVLARSQFGQTVTRKRPLTSTNASGHPSRNYGSLSSLSVNVVIVKNKQENQQKFEGLKEVFPAHLVGATDLDIQDFDLIVTATEIFQVKNAQLKANNITGAISTDPSYFYCDLDYFDHDTTIEN